MPKGATARQCVGMSDSGAKNRFKTNAVNKINGSPHTMGRGWGGKREPPTN